MTKRYSSNLWLRSKLKLEYVSDETLIILLFLNYLIVLKLCRLIASIIVNCNNLYIILSYYHVPSEKLFSNILCLTHYYAIHYALRLYISDFRDSRNKLFTKYIFREVAVTKYTMNNCKMIALV